MRENSDCQTMAVRISRIEMIYILNYLPLTPDQPFHHLILIEHIQADHQQQEHYLPRIDGGRDTREEKGMDGNVGEVGCWRLGLNR